MKKKKITKCNHHKPLKIFIPSYTHVSDEVYTILIWKRCRRICYKPKIDIPVALYPRDQDETNISVFPSLSEIIHQNKSIFHIRWKVTKKQSI